MGCGGSASVSVPAPAPTAGAIVGVGTNFPKVVKTKADMVKAENELARVRVEFAMIPVKLLYPATMKVGDYFQRHGYGNEVVVVTAVEPDETRNRAKYTGMIVFGSFQKTGTTFSWWEGYNDYYRIKPVVGVVKL